MYRLISVLGLAALLIGLTPLAALAKGPVAVSIAGPGGSDSIAVDGRDGGGEPGSGGDLGNLAEAAGLFAVGLGQQDARLTAQRPSGDLGPAFTLSWTIPTGAADDNLVQTLYPYAEAGAVTYTEAGQSYLGSQTSGGWYIGGRGLSDALVAVGVPGQPQATGPTTAQIAFGLLGVCALAALLLLARRGVERRGADALAHS